MRLLIIVLSCTVSSCATVPDNPQLAGRISLLEAKVAKLEKSYSLLLEQVDQIVTDSALKSTTPDDSNAVFP